MAYYQSSQAAKGTSGYGRRTTTSPTNNLGITSYVQNLITGMRINFTTVPDTINESISTVFNSLSIPGRSDPLFYYSNTGPRNITFTLPIVDDFTPYGIVYTTNQLKGLAYPRYQGYVVQPPKCFLKVGNFISLSGFLENVEVDWQPTPIREGIYNFANVAMTFTQAVSVPFDTVQVEQGAIN